MSSIKGITVILYDTVESGTDGFNRPIYEEEAIEVENVLIEPVSSTDITDELNLTGRYVQYRLCIPKGDTNDWENKKVEFFDETFRTVGAVTQYIEDMVPLDWNKKVLVEKYE